MKRLSFLVLILSFVFACSDSNKIQSGDIVFRSATSSSLSEAINNVTQTQKATNYSHIGVCDVVDGSIYIYHSDLGKGVVHEPLEAFMKATDTVKYVADFYRIKNITSNQVENALNRAKTFLGQPYNTTYILEDNGLYCSEYIYEVFKEDTIFELEPMTFKNPETKVFHEGWIKHYEELGIEIPEGKLGCNPNGMANSKHLEFVKSLTTN